MGNASELELLRATIFESSTVLKEALAEPGGVPTWIQLTPNGGGFQARDGRKFNVENPEEIVKAFNSSGEHIVIDIDHDSELGGTTVASGWITEMAVRLDGQIWGKAEFTPSGTDKLSTRELRGVSPAFVVEPESLQAAVKDSDNRMEVTGFRSVGLTNKPALRLPSLNNHQGDDSKMDREALANKLGLNSAATDEDITAAITKLQAPASIDDVVPRADLEAVKLELNSMKAESAKATRVAFESQCAAVVDKAAEEGRISPASREYHLTSCLRGGDALTAFQTYVKDASPMVNNTQLAGRSEEESDPRVYTADEKKIMSKLGVTSEQVAKASESMAKNQELYPAEHYGNA